METKQYVKIEEFLDKKIVFHVYTDDFSYHQKIIRENKGAHPPLYKITAKIGLHTPFEDSIQWKNFPRREVVVYVQGIEYTFAEILDFQSFLSSANNNGKHQLIMGFRAAVPMKQRHINTLS